MFELEINGKKITLRFGPYQAMMLAKLGDSVNELDKVVAFIYYAHEADCKRKEIMPQVTKGEIFAWMEDNDRKPEQQQLYLDMMAAYQATLPQAQPDVSAKKKAAPRAVGKK